MHWAACRRGRAGRLRTEGREGPARLNPLNMPPACLTPPPNAAPQQPARLPGLAPAAWTQQHFKIVLLGELTHPGSLVRRLLHTLTSITCSPQVTAAWASPAFFCARRAASSQTTSTQPLALPSLPLRCPWRMGAVSSWRFGTPQASCEVCRALAAARAEAGWAGDGSSAKLEVWGLAGKLWMCRAVGAVNCAQHLPGTGVGWARCIPSCPILLGSPPPVRLFPPPTLLTLK